MKKINITEKKLKYFFLIGYLVILLAIIIASFLPGSIVSQTKMFFSLRHLISQTNVTFKYVIRKLLGHWGAFFGLGIFSSGFLYLEFENKIDKIIAIPFNTIHGFLMGLVSEFIQTFVDGRYGVMDDVLIDFYGFITAQILTLITIKIIEYIKRKKLK